MTRSYRLAHKTGVHGYAGRHKKAVKITVVWLGLNRESGEAWRGRVLILGRLEALCPGGSPQKRPDSAHETCRQSSLFGQAEASRPSAHRYLEWFARPLSRRQFAAAINVPSRRDRPGKPCEASNTCFRCRSI